MQRDDVTSMTYVRDEFIIAGQVFGFFDVVNVTEQPIVSSHALQIEQAGDVNYMTQGPKIGDVMIACQSGLLLCNVSEDGQLNILRQIDEYSGLYCINIGWAAA